MACAQQAVLEFDEEVRAPWRPRLVPDLPAAGAETPRGPQQRRPSRPSPARMAVGRQPTEPRPLPATGARVARSNGAAERPVQARRTVAGRPRAARLRLTRRARRLATVLGLAAGVALGSWVGPLVGGGAEGDLRLVGVTSVVVEPGDTLWSIATSLGGEGDVRAVIDEIQELNDLESAELTPGQTLRLP
jgi:nucleoid-associated protein YgaU